MRVESEEEQVNPPVDVCNLREHTDYGEICFTLTDDVMTVKFTKNDAYTRAELLLAYQSNSYHSGSTLLTRDYYASE